MELHQILDHPSYLGRVRDERLQMFSWFDWRPEYPDPYYFLDPLFHSQGSENFAGYVNPELDRLLERARIEMNQESRIELYHRAEELILQDAPGYLCGTAT